MLIISRKKGETIYIGNSIEIKIVSIEKNQVKLGIKAPENIKILRGELLEKIKAENKKASINNRYDDVINQIKKVFK